MKASLSTAVLLMMFLSADALQPKPFSLRERFEDSLPPIAVWASNGECTINQLCLSDEKVFEGRKSLKLDVTITSGSYHYFGVTVKVPCEGRLRMTARLWLGEGTSGQAGFGSNFTFPPTLHSGCWATQSYTGPTGQWKTIECDLVSDGRKGKAEVLARHAPGVRPEDAGVVLDKWSIFIYGQKGQRAVVYLDDIKIEGEVPSIDDYENELAFRWEKPREKEVLRLDVLKNRLAAGDSALAPFADQPEAVALRSRAAAGAVLIEQCKKKGYCDADEETSFQSGLAAVSAAPEKLSLLASARKKNRPFMLFTPRAVSDTIWPDNAFPFAAPAGDTLFASACRGEYEPFTALLYALTPARPLEIETEELSCKAGKIPADSIDLRVVKCWFKAGRRINDVSHTGYFPELLVKDDSLVLADPAKKVNRLRSTAADGTKKYLVCPGEGLADLKPLDAGRFVPFDMERNSLRQFWFTLHAPDSARAGVYKGKIIFRARGIKLAVPLIVTIRPFDLRQAGLTYSIYYRGVLSADLRPQISSDQKNEQQYRAEMADLLAHGILFPTSYQPYHERLLKKALEIRKEAGLPAGVLYNLGTGTGSDTAAGPLMLLAQRTGQWLDFVRPFGYDKVFFYGADEATGERLAAQRRAWKVVQDAGGKTFVACGPDAYDSMGTLLNCAVLGGKPDPALAKKWHSMGSLVFCYGWPQAGEITPETYRRHFGLELWKAGFDGAMDYAYQHGFNHIWNDFDDGDLCFAYPTVNGVVGTIQWEGFREAVDDVRYLTTLQRAISSAPAAKKDIAEKALAWLNSLDPSAADLYRARSEMAEWISKITE